MLEEIAALGGAYDLSAGQLRWRLLRSFGRCSSAGSASALPVLNRVWEEDLSDVPAVIHHGWTVGRGAGMSRRHEVL